MDKKTQGAWIIHHGRKLQDVKNAEVDFEQIDYASKCGHLLSAICASDENIINKSRAYTLARASNIKKRETDDILSDLSARGLIDFSTKQLAVLGVAPNIALEVTSDVFKENNPTPSEEAVIGIAEKCSEIPSNYKDTAEYISDAYLLPTQESRDLLIQVENIGFTDYIGDNQHNRVYFNGNLFKAGAVRKIQAVLASLPPPQEQNVIEVSQMLDNHACILKSELTDILGRKLFDQLHSIGFYDVNSVSNSYGEFDFVTKPGAFCKFTNAMIDDAFDLAKLFVTSLTYGMEYSKSNRGRITQIEALMKKLISGAWIGPATAIGEDYKPLELRGVVTLSHSHGSQYHMRLLKKEVGELALKVIQDGDASTVAMSKLPSSQINDYTGPEENRIITRKKTDAKIQSGVTRMINELRTGVV